MAEVPALNFPDIQASHWATANAINKKKHRGGTDENL